jgi:hypothetical protein
VQRPYPKFCRATTLIAITPGWLCDGSFGDKIARGRVGMTGVNFGTPIAVTL